MTNTSSVPHVPQPRTAGRQSARQRLRGIMTSDLSGFASMDVEDRPHTLFSLGRVAHEGLFETRFLVPRVCSLFGHFSHQDTAW